MELLYTMLGFRLVFGTRTGCTVFAVLGTAATIAIMASGRASSLAFGLLVASAFAARRAFAR